MLEPSSSPYASANQVLTDLAIKTAEPVITLWDGTLKGFGIRIGKERKTFVVLIASGRRQTIGHYPLMSLADARREARRILAEKELGRIRPTRVAFDDAKRDFLADCAKKNRPRTLRDYAWLLERLPFGRQSVGDITPREIIRRLKELDDAPATKQHVFVCARAFFRWCVRQHLIDRSPCENLQTPPNGKSRERVLSLDELKALYLTCSGMQTPFSYIVSLLILTGQRRGEIAALEWSWIDQADKTIAIPARVAKNNRAHLIPYGTMTQAILDAIPRHLDCPYLFPAARQRSDRTTVFNGWAKPKAKLDAHLPLAPWTLHDLRRTYSSVMASLGVPQIVVEKLLNHVTGGAQSAIAATYNRYNYLKEMRDVVLRYEAYLTTLIEPTA